MKSRLLIIGMIVFSFIVPQAFGDNEFCNIMENLKIQEELIKDDIILIEFLKVLPHAKLTRANIVEWSNPEQTSMTWIAGVYSLDILWGFDEDNPSNCFFPGGYRLNAPHLPEMTGNDYHKDSRIVLEQIEELEPKYVKGGPAPMLEEPEPIEPTDEITDEQICASGSKLIDGICIVEKEIPDNELSKYLALFFFSMTPVWFVASVLYFIFGKKYKTSITIILAIVGVLWILGIYTNTLPVSFG